MAISDNQTGKDLEPELTTRNLVDLSDIVQMATRGMLTRVSFRAKAQMPEVPVKSVTILLPALDEEDGIGEVIDSIPLGRLEAMGFRTDILVVDGHSKDMTIDIARGTGAKIAFQQGTGKGHAVRLGMDIANSDFLVMLDADGTYPTEDIPAFLRMLQDGADVVMGSRLIGKIEDGAMSDLNKAGNRILSFIASMAYKKRVTDLCTGMWAFNKKAIETLKLNSTGFEIEAEMFAQASKAGLAIRETPIRYSPRLGKPKLGSIGCGLRIGLKLIRKRFL